MLTIKLESLEELVDDSAKIQIWAEAVKNRLETDELDAAIEDIVSVREAALAMIMFVDSQPHIYMKDHKQLIRDYFELDMILLEAVDEVHRVSGFSGKGKAHTYSAPKPAHA